MASVCMYVCNTITFVNLNRECLFLYTHISPEIQITFVYKGSRSRSRSRSRSQQQKEHLCVACSNALIWNAHYCCARAYSEYLGQGHTSRSFGEGQGHWIQKYSGHTNERSALDQKTFLYSFHFDVVYWTELASVRVLNALWILARQIRNRWEDDTVIMVR